MNKLAQINIAPQNGYTGFGPLGNPGNSGINVFTGVVSTAIGIMTLVAFIWFTFNFIIGAIGIMTAGSDKQKLEGSRQKIVNGIIGIVVVIAAVSVISLIGALFDVDILNLPKLFNQILNNSGGGSLTTGVGPTTRLK